MSTKEIPLQTPPVDGLLDPLIDVWRPLRPWVRCHSVRFGATEFNPGVGEGRFHPFRSPEGKLVSTLYGASSIDGALSEVVYHSVPIRGPGRFIRRSSLRPLVVSTLVARRALRLARLHGHGLRRLGVARRELIDCEAESYEVTRLWAQALHRCQAQVDGLVWVSRQHDTSHALVLFGDRVDRRDLDLVEVPLPLYFSPGFNEVQRVAEEAGITVLE